MELDVEPERPGGAPASRKTLCCGVRRRTLLQKTERSIPGAWTRDPKVILGPWRSRYLGLCLPGARR